MRRNERPTPRTNPVSGKKVYVARWHDKAGKAHYGWKPDIPGTYKLRKDAQAAIYACYDREDAGPANPNTVGGYFQTWVDHHPRSAVTNRTNTSRINAVLDVVIEGAALKDWPFSEIRRRHVSAIVKHMLVDQGRAYTGAQGILRALSAMTEDAMDDEVATGNPFKGAKIRSNDPRVQKPIRPIRVWSWEEMHEFAAECGRSPGAGLVEAHRAVIGEAMVRTLSDCGLRIGELLAVRRRDLNLERGILEIRQTLTPYRIEAGTKVDKLRATTTGSDEVGREVPIPPALLVMLKDMPKRIDADLLFPAVGGGPWTYAHWFKDVWTPARKRLGMDARPHEFRHSWVSHVRAAGVDDADLAAISGHSVLTMIGKYTHGLNRSFDAVRAAVGE